MHDDIAIISDFVKVNSESLAYWMRRKLIQAGAKDYVKALGKDGIEAMRCEAAGLLLDLGCAMVNRLKPEVGLTSEDVISKLPESERRMIRLPRSDTYHAALESL